MERIVFFLSLQCLTIETYMIMKKMLFLAMAMFVVVHVAAQDSVRKLIEDYLMENANDPSKVEIVRIEPLRNDSVYGFIETEEHDSIVSNLNFWHESFEFWKNEDLKEAEASLKQIKEYTSALENASKKFKPYLRGKKTIVKYRSQNKLGVLELYRARVKFDKGVTRLTDFKIIEE